MSLINTTLVVQLNEANNVPSLGAAASATNSLAANNANAKQDGSLGIMVDGAFVTTAAEAGANAFIKLCTFHAGEKGSTVFTSSSEFKIGEITDVAYYGPSADVAGTDLAFNSFSYYESTSSKTSTLRKDAVLGNGSLKGVREKERLSAISSGSYNQETYDKVNPASNADTGQDFSSYTITVRKKVAKNYVTEIIRVYINHVNAHTKAALQTILGLGAIADGTPPAAGDASALFSADSYAVSTTPNIVINIASAETSGTFTGTITTTDTPAYVYTLTPGTLSSSGAAAITITDFVWGSTSASKTFNLSVNVTDDAGNITIKTDTAATTT